MEDLIIQVKKVASNKQPRDIDNFVILGHHQVASHQVFNPCASWDLARLHLMEPKIRYQIKYKIVRALRRVGNPLLRTAELCHAYRKKLKDLIDAFFLRLKSFIRNCKVSIYLKIQYICTTCFCLKSDSNVMEETRSTRSFSPLFIKNRKKD